MILGILETDLLDPELVRSYGSYDQMFRHLLLQVDAELEFKNYPVTRLRYPLSIDECDAYLITGSKSSVYDNEDWIAELMDFVRELNHRQKRLIGICFGHQLVAEALGGKVSKSEKGWGVGVQTSNVVSQKPWMQPAADQISLVVSHQDQVTILPYRSELIVSSPFCENGGFCIGEHIFTLQAHPEFSIAYARDRIQSRKHLIDDSRFQAAIQSYDLPTDHITVAHWIIRFINQ